MITKDTKSKSSSSEDGSLQRMLQAGADIAGGLTGSVIGMILAGHAGVVAGGVAGPTISHTLQKIGREVAGRLLGKREEKRVGAVLTFAAQKVEENMASGRQVRNDGFFDEQPDGRSAADEIAEGVLMNSQRAYEERKIRFYGNLLGNLAFTSAYDRAYSNLLITIAEQLSYRQLCLLSIVHKNKSLGLQHLTLRKSKKDITGPQVALIQELFSLSQRGLIVDDSNTIWLDVSDATVNGSLTELGTALHELMELGTLPASDLQQTAALLP